MRKLREDLSITPYVDIVHASPNPVQKVNSGSAAIHIFLCCMCLIAAIAFFGANLVFAETDYPDLRDAHNPELQKALDKALGSSHPEFWNGVKKKEMSIVIADVTDLKNLRSPGITRI